MVSMYATQLVATIRATRLPAATRAIFKLEKAKESKMSLVLSRKVDQTLIIGDSVITVSRIKGNSVRLAIDAPNSVGIMRGELKPESAEKYQQKRMSHANTTHSNSRTLPRQ